MADTESGSRSERKETKQLTCAGGRGSRVGTTSATGFRSSATTRSGKRHHQCPRKPTQPLASACSQQAGSSLTSPPLSPSPQKLKNPQQPPPKKKQQQQKTTPNNNQNGKHSSIAARFSQASLVPFPILIATLLLMQDQLLPLHLFSVLLQKAYNSLKQHLCLSDPFPFRFKKITSYFPFPNNGPSPPYTHAHTNSLSLTNTHTHTQTQENHQRTTETHIPPATDLSPPSD